MAMLEINWRPGTRELRQFGALFVLAAAGLAAYGLLGGAHPALGWGALGAAAGAALAWLFYPRALHPAYVILMAAALPVGVVVSTVLLAVIYFGILTPIGILTRIFGHDPMGKRFDKSATSYWIERKPADDIKRYFRQY